MRFVQSVQSVQGPDLQGPDFQRNRCRIFDFDCAGVIRKVAHIAVMWYKDRRQKTDDRGPFDKLRVNSRQRTE